MNPSRSHFRIRFPEPDRAHLETPLGEFDVLDLSESGASVSLRTESSRWNSTIPVRVVLRDNTTFATTASVVRQEPDKLVLEFGKYIPQSMIIAEQRRLLALYPKETLRNGSFGERKSS